MKPQTVRCRRRHAGNTMIEVMVAGLIALLSGSALIALLQSSYTASAINLGQNTVNASVRAPLDLLADRLRSAQSYYNGTLYKAISAASASDITLYTDTTGNNTARYWLDTTVTPHVLKQTLTTGGTPTTTTILSGVQTLNFTYWVSGGNYNAGLSIWVKTALPQQPTAAELPKIGAIQIQIGALINGYSRTINSCVRLRNSPYP
jgi:hypothetical protein